MEGSETYLGDGVYVKFDGYQFWVETQEGMSIALEPPVLTKLIEYAVSKGYQLPTIKEN